jgi:CMP-N,N'-diacetyllegionaminic acid synthase
MTIVAIIPARSGSKGIPRKNLKPFLGHPLIAWSIGQSLRSEKINRTIVSTDDEEIREVALQYGAEAPFLRPPELAQDDTPTEPVLLHALDFLKEQGEEPDAIVLLQPTSPVRLDGTIDLAITTFEDGAYDSLLSVYSEHHFHWRNPSNPEALYDVGNRPRRQNVPESDHFYSETGSIYVTKASVLRSEGNRLGGKIGLFQTKRVENFDIDTEEDFRFVEMVGKSVVMQLPVPELVL